MKRILCIYITAACLLFCTGALADLFFGSSGPEVVRLQQALAGRGYQVGSADGRYGAFTEAAVRLFQRESGLSVTGIADAQTLALLYGTAVTTASPYVPYATPRPTAAPAAQPVSYFGGDYTTLRMGSRGTQVTLLQTALNRLGYSCGTADGIFGNATYSALVRFQSANRLSVTGIADRNVLQLIERLLGGSAVTAAPTALPWSTPAPTAVPWITAAPTAQPVPYGAWTPPSVTLRQGSYGAAVTSLQTRLRELGWFSGTPDGYFGSSTRAAVVAFQQRCGLTADGVAGPQTYARLALVNAPALTTPAVTAVPTPQPTAVPILQPTAAPMAAWTAPSRTLRLGNSGAAVVRRQRRLRRPRWSTGHAHGYFDAATRLAVVSFQSRCGLTADGIAGPATYSQLASSSAPRSGAPVTTSTPWAVVTPTPYTVITPAPTTAPVTAWTIPSRTLRLGNSGADVTSLQQRLQELGWYTGSANGYFDAATRLAVVDFQSRCGLTADGIAGPATYSQLASPTAPRKSGSTVTSTPAPTVQPVVTGVPVPTAQPVVSTTLRKGMSGTQVEQLQRALAFLDYTTSTYGTYDNATVAAVKAFQQNNGLTADGIAGPATLTKVYSGTAVKGSSGAGIAASVGQMAAPSVSQLRLLHWFNDIKPTMRNGQTLLVYDPVTGLSWTLRNMSLGRHADVEPLTATDTAIQFRAFGNRSDWGPKAVYVQLPSGLWTVATMHNVAHGSQTIKNNNFDGQNCVHFLRDMSECQQNDPSYGVTNQTLLRTFWKKLTGEEITY